MIDLQLWRKQKISEKAIEYLTLYPDRIKFVDQDALNAVLKNNWCKLDWKFNVIYSRLPQDATLNDLMLFIENKVIIHFTLQRPWFKLCKNRLKFLYSKYLLLSNSLDKNIYVHDVNYSIKAHIKLALLEFYLDNKILNKSWRAFKSLINFH